MEAPGGQSLLPGSWTCTLPRLLAWDQGLLPWGHLAELGYPKPWGQQPQSWEVVCLDFLVAEVKEMGSWSCGRTVDVAPRLLKQQQVCKEAASSLVAWSSSEWALLGAGLPHRDS